MARCLAVLSTFTFLLLAACAQDGVAAIEDIDNAVAKLDEAFEARDAAAVKALMTEDHLAVTPYYSGPVTADDVVASLSAYKIKQTDLSEPKVVLLGSDHAMRTLTAKLDGTFADEPISDKVFITSILVKQNGKWLEQFYQVTALAP